MCTYADNIQMVTGLQVQRQRLAAMAIEILWSL